MVIRKDNFKDAIMFAPVGSNQWMTFGDDDYTSLREKLEKRGFKPIGREIIRDAVGLVARDNQFDSAIEWLNQQEWDGLSRADSFLTIYYGVDDSAYSRAVSRYIWTALAGRVLVPGIKADMVPIFVGLQGTFKSTSVKALAPSVESFAEFNLAARDADLSRKMRGCLVGEIGELRGLHTKDLESIKSFLTQTHEKWTPKFKEFEATFPRRLIFFGTTNQDEFLADITGNRRFLPVRVGKVDLDAINRDRDQLWAEGVALFLTAGVAFKAAESLAESVHEEHVITDPWAEVVSEWLDTVDPITGEIPRMCKFLQTANVLRDAVGIDAKGIGKPQEMRIAAVLKQIGYSRKKLRVGKSTVWAFVPGGSDH
jgi:predicted P-loop ATPase